MKRYSNSLFAFLSSLLLFSGCNSSEVIYSGEEYVMFADSVMVLPIQTKDSIFEIALGVTTASGQDRTFAVEVMENRSKAIEGVHYEMLSHNVIIKAGERSGKVQLRGIYDNIGDSDSLYVRLKVVADKNLKWSMYPDEISINFVKCRPFHLDDYVGNMRLYASFPFGDQMEVHPVMSEKWDEKTLIIKEPYAKNYDMVIKFDDSDPLDPQITIASHIAFIDANYGKIYARTVAQSPSYFDAYRQMLMCAVEFYIPGVGSFGVQKFVFQWITPEQAELDKNGI